MKNGFSMKTLKRNRWVAHQNGSTLLMMNKGRNGSLETVNM